MGEIKNLTGQTFTRLTALYYHHSDRFNKSFWFTKCECGNTRIVREDSLVSGTTKSCGCIRSDVLKKVAEKKIIDLTDKNFGRLLVTKFSCIKNKRSYWLAKCDCGKIVVVNGTNLRSGHTKSCGCLQKERLLKSLITHGLSNTKEYNNALTRKRREMKRRLDCCWTTLMEICLHNYQPVCVVCGSNDRLAVDHVNSLSNGYGLYPGNAVILCKHCNSAKHTKTLDQLPIEMATKIREAAESFRIAWSGGF